MASYTPMWSHPLTLVVALSCCIRLAAAVSQGTVLYCSELNTGSDFNPVYYQYQSYGECRDTCSLDNNYALSIIQGKNCWCSDYIPGATNDNNDCTQTCPGYPDDICGGKNLFVYYQMNKAASGTKGGGSSESKTSKSKSDPPPPPTPTPPPTNKPSPTPTWTPTPSLSLESIGQSVRTVTVTPTAPPAAESAGSTPPKKKSGGGLGTGGAVGLAIGLIALFAMICGAVFWFWRKKKRQENEEEARRNMQDSKRSSTSALRSDMTRSMSQHSRFVLGSNGQTVVGGFEPVTPMVESNGSSRVSAHGLKPVDPRLDPFGVAYGNRSRESLNTINDGHDYTRKILRTTNPDPDDD